VACARRESDEHARYPWPASAITREDMSLLFLVREQGSKRIPITELIAHAVRETYGRQDNLVPFVQPDGPDEATLRAAA
jgi:hypothetical protein